MPRCIDCHYHKNGTCNIRPAVNESHKCEDFRPTTQKILDAINERKNKMKESIEKPECPKIKTIDTVDIEYESKIMYLQCPYCKQDFDFKDGDSEHHEIVDDIDNNAVCFFDCPECKRIIQILDYNENAFRR